MKELTYQSVWETLSKVNVDDYKKKKGDLDYLGWSMAWSILMEHYPYAQYEFKDEKFLENGTCLCHVDLTIGDLKRPMWLAVMNYANKSVVNPTYQQIQNTRMRCLVKAIAMFGLGFYIYEGEKSFPYEDEDLPNESKDLEEAELVSSSQEGWVFEFVKTGGYVVGGNTAEDFMNAFEDQLNNPTNVMHIKTYKRNEKVIKEAMAQLKEDSPAWKRYQTLIGLYEGEEDV